MRHFLLPGDILLELLERILKDPDVVYVEELENAKAYKMFYRLFEKRYILAVVKVIPEGAFFASMYTTGESVRKSHERLKKLKL